MLAERALIEVRRGRPARNPQAGHQQTLRLTTLVPCGGYARCPTFAVPPVATAVAVRQVRAQPGSPTDGLGKRKHHAPQASNGISSKKCRADRICEIRYLASSATDAEEIERRRDDKNRHPASVNAGSDVRSAPACRGCQVRRHPGRAVRSLQCQRRRRVRSGARRSRRSIAYVVISSARRRHDAAASRFDEESRLPAADYHRRRARFSYRGYSRRRAELLALGADQSQRRRHRQAAAATSKCDQMFKAESRPRPG